MAYIMKNMVNLEGTSQELFRKQKGIQIQVNKSLNLNGWVHDRIPPNQFS